MASSLGSVDKIRDKEKILPDADMEESNHDETTLLEEYGGDPARLPLSRDSQHPKNDLSWPARGTLQRQEATQKENQERMDKLCGAVRTILDCVGEDPDREGLLNTPMRYAEAMLFFTRGYEDNLQNIVNNAVFSEEYEGMVLLKDIEFSSLCEHHLVPFLGKVHLGYIPQCGNVVGLSKLVRVVEMLSRRLQVQERLTYQIAHALFDVLQPEGVAVVVEASHLCIEMRGVQKTGVNTVTDCMLGCFQPAASKSRDEFLNFVVGRK